jgi:hypothetical protein
MLQWHDVANRRWVFVAKCHGEQDTCRVYDIDIAASRQVFAGVAFTGNKLSEPATGIEPVRNLHTPNRVPDARGE